jgi:hypothetical protein
MSFSRIAVSAAFAVGLAALPPAARAQYYRPCPPFLLALPFCVAGAVVVGAVTIATIPFRALAGPPYYAYYRRPYGPPPPPYYAPRYGPPPYDYGPR